jgi:hypothetical protein
MVDAAYYQDLLRPIFRGRKVIICGLPLAGTTRLIKSIRALGSDRCLVVANGTGTGPLPSPDDADSVIVEIHAKEIIEEFRQTENMLRNPPRRVIAAIEAFDPERNALLFVTVITLSELPAAIAGRRVWARRSAASFPLEDKVTADAFWDSVGVLRAPSRIVPVETDAIQSAWRLLDHGMGVAVAGDARDGVHGGAERLRWVRSRSELLEAEAFFREHCDRVRVMPFLEGIPCSIHGVVIGDTVIALRPIEMITLRYLDSHALRYCGTADFWDPPEKDREYMRQVAKQVGHALRERIGFRGAFTIDGVMTEDGFRPTELNPRYGAGLAPIARSQPDLPLGLVFTAVLAGEPLDYRPMELERLLVEGADRQRSGSAYTVINAVHTETRRLPLTVIPGGYRVASEGEEPAATLSVGPGAMGGFVAFEPDPKRVPIGPSIAPAAVAAFELADRHLQTGIGSLHAASDISRRQ